MPCISGAYLTIWQSSYLIDTYRLRRIHAKINTFSWIVIKKKITSTNLPHDLGESSHLFGSQLSLAVKRRDASDISTCSKILRFRITCLIVGCHQVEQLLAHKWNEGMGGPWKERVWFWGTWALERAWDGQERKEKELESKLVWNKVAFKNPWPRTTW